MSLSDDDDLGNFMPVQDIKIEIIPIRAALPAFKVLKNHEQARVRSALDMTGECAFLALNSDRFKMPVMRSTQMPSASELDLSWHGRAFYLLAFIF